jgi:hypothetical protein
MEPCWNSKVHGTKIAHLPLTANHGAGFIAANLAPNIRVEPVYGSIHAYRLWASTSAPSTLDLNLERISNAVFPLSPGHTTLLSTGLEPAFHHEIIKFDIVHLIPVFLWPPPCRPSVRQETPGVPFALVATITTTPVVKTNEGEGPTAKSSIMIGKPRSRQRRCTGSHPKDIGVVEDHSKNGKRSQSVNTWHYEDCVGM